MTNKDTFLQLWKSNGNDEIKTIKRKSNQLKSAMFMYE